MLRKILLCFAFLFRQMSDANTQNKEQLFKVIPGKIYLSSISEPPLLTQEVNTPTSCAGICLATSCCVSSFLVEQADTGTYRCQVFDIIFADKFLTSNATSTYMYKTPGEGQFLSFFVLNSLFTDTSFK